MLKTPQLVPMFFNGEYFPIKLVVDWKDISLHSLALGEDEVGTSVLGKSVGEPKSFTDVVRVQGQSLSGCEKVGRRGSHLFVTIR